MFVYFTFNSLACVIDHADVCYNANWCKNNYITVRKIYNSLYAQIEPYVDASAYSLQMCMTNCAEIKRTKEPYMGNTYETSIPLVERISDLALSIHNCTLSYLFVLMAPIAWRRHRSSCLYSYGIRLLIVGGHAYTGRDLYSSVPRCGEGFCYSFFKPSIQNFSYRIITNVLYLHLFLIYVSIAYQSSSSRGTCKL